MEVDRHSQCCWRYRQLIGMDMRCSRELMLQWLQHMSALIREVEAFGIDWDQMVADATERSTA